MLRVTLQLAALPWLCFGFLQQANRARTIVFGAKPCRLPEEYNVAQTASYEHRKADKSIGLYRKPYTTNKFERETITLVRNITKLSDLSQHNPNLHLFIPSMHPRVAAEVLNALTSVGSHKDSMLLDSEYDALVESTFRSLYEQVHEMPFACTISSFVCLNHAVMRSDNRSWPVREILWNSLASDAEQIMRDTPVRRLAKLLQASSVEHPSGVLLHTTPLYDLICLRLGRGDALDALSVSNMRHILRTIVVSPLTEVRRNLVKGMLRRLRKQSLRNASKTEDLVHILQSCKRLQPISTLRNETKTAVYTLAKHVFESPLSARQISIALVSVKDQLNDMPDFVCDYVTSLERTPCIAELCEAVLHWRVADERSRLMLERFCSEFSERSEPIPIDVISLLRVAGLLFTEDWLLLERVYNSLEHHFLNPSFLSKCRSRDLANISWFLAVKAQTVDPEKKKTVAIALTTELSEKRANLDISPKIASRLLSCITALFPSPENSIDLTKLYQTVEGNLLVDRLDVTDITSSMVAFAKRPSRCNATIFEHLSNELASKHIRNCSCRQAAQALWACGKLSEQYDREKSPLAASALAFLGRLVRDINDVAPLDLAQSIWALARLGVRSDDVLLLTERARSLNNMLKETEVANIVWGVSKLRIRDFKTVFVLTRRYCNANSASLLKVKPEEASSILYALGCLDIRDERVFRELTNALLSRVHETNAQAIANVIWAHQTVHIKPPASLVKEGARLKGSSLRVIRP